MSRYRPCANSRCTTLAQSYAAIAAAHKISKLDSPKRLDHDRVLVVGASNPVVRQELLLQKATVLARVRAIPACAQIEDVVFRAG